MSDLVPAVTLRCSVCGGYSTIAGAIDPRGVTWMCPHHGTGAADDDVGFDRSGLGRVGGEFVVEELDAVDVEEASWIDTSRAVSEQSWDVSDAQMFDDLEAVTHGSQSVKEIAAERGVVPSTVRDGAMRARRALGE